ncbi:MAG: glycosyltransferase [Tannerella sp.]|jgi:rhamnosyltransferase|nr:glycosyltransferase [Tannerella sp.]
MNEDKMTVGVVVPTYNGGMRWMEAAASLQAQHSDFDRILIIDSGSSDATVAIAKKAGFDVENITYADFNHGATRNYGLHKTCCDIVVFLTQDALIGDKAISEIANAFRDKSVAVAYGRQLPHDDATPMAKHARSFNYKEKSYTYRLNDKSKHGIKTVFASNSFSAYRADYFDELGGFPENIIFAEDMYFTAKALLSGYSVRYVAEATCRHSHNYLPVQEFRRYFDTGVFHRNEAWIFETFGDAGGEGLKFIFSELSFLWKNRDFAWMPVAVVNNLFKILGYKAGLNYRKIPHCLLRHFSGCKSYWNHLQ